MTPNALCGAGSDLDRLSFTVTFGPSGSFGGQAFIAAFGDCIVEGETRDLIATGAAFGGVEVIDYEADARPVATQVKLLTLTVEGQARQDREEAEGVEQEPVAHHLAQGDAAGAVDERVGRRRHRQ